MITIGIGAPLIFAPHVAVGVYLGMWGVEIARGMHFDAFVNARSVLLQAQYENKAAFLEDMKSAHVIVSKAKLDEEVNPMRIRKGKSELSLEEYLQKKPFKAKPTPMDELVASIEGANYDQVAQVIRDLSRDDSFCKNADVVGANTLRKIVIKNLK